MEVLAQIEEKNKQAFPVSETSIIPELQQKNAQAFDVPDVTNEKVSNPDKTLPAKSDIFTDYSQSLPAFQELVDKSDDPIGELSRLQASKYIADLEGLPLEEVYANIDNYSTAMYGKVLPEKTFGKMLVDTWNDGMIANQLGVLRMDQRYDKSPELAKKIADLEAKQSGPGFWESHLPIPFIKDILSWTGGVALPAIMSSAQYMAAGLTVPTQKDITGYISDITMIPDMENFDHVAQGEISIEKNIAQLEWLLMSPLYNAQVMHKIIQGNQYDEMIKAGVNDKAAFALSGISGLMQTAIESAGLAEYMGVGIVNKVTKGALKDFLFNKRALKAALSYFGTAAVEGSEEGIQYVAEVATKSIGTAIERARGTEGVTGPQDDMSGVLKELGKNIEGGIAASLFLGIPAAGISIRGDAKEVRQIAEYADNTASKEAFIKDTAEFNIFEGMTDEKRTEAQSKIWEAAAQKREEAVKAETEDIAEYISGDAEVTQDDAVQTTPRGEVQRVEDRLYTQFDNKKQNADGSESGEFIVGNPNEETNYNDYGHIYYTLDETKNTVTIDDVRIQGSQYKGILKEFVNDFSAQFPGKEIIWEPQRRTLQGIKAELIAENPRGAKAGLQYFENESEQANIRGRIKLDAQIKTYLPKLDPTERAVAVALLETGAATKGLDLETYIGNTFHDQIFAPVGQNVIDAAQKEGIQADGIKGGVGYPVDNLSRQAKALIYVTEKSDFSTYVHEVSHVWRSQMTGDLLTEAETAFGVTDGKWTRDQEEKFAVGFEDYLREGKAPTTALENLYRKAAEFLQRIYQALSNRVEVSPEIRRVYDQLVAGQTPLAAVARSQQITPAVKKTQAVEEKAAVTTEADQENAFEASQTDETVKVESQPAKWVSRTEATQKIIDEAGAKFWENNPDAMMFERNVKYFEKALDNSQFADILILDKEGSYDAVSEEKYEETEKIVEKGLANIEKGIGSGRAKPRVWSVYKDLKKYKTSHIIGKTVDIQNGKLTATGWSQLSETLSVYRNRSFETFRYIYVNADTGAIEKHVAVSSRMPGKTGVAPSNQDIGLFLSWAETEARQSNQKIIVVHNHPSGQTEPSYQDISVTERIEMTFGDVFAGHIILDHGKFGLYAKGESSFSQEKIEGFQNKIDPTEKIRLTKKELKSIKVTGPGTLRQAAEYVEDDENYIGVAFVNAASKVCAIEYFERSFFEDSLESEKATNKANKKLSKSALSYGAHLAFVCSKKQDSKLVETVKTAINNGLYIQDYLIGDVNGNDNGVAGNRLDQGRKIKTVEVNENVSYSSDNSILFQTINQELADDAAQFSDWRMFMEFCEDPDTRDMLGGIETIPEDADQDWYETFWKQAKNIEQKPSYNTFEIEEELARKSIVTGSPDALDALWMVEIAKPGKLEEFLEAIYEITHFDQKYQPADQEELDRFNEIKRLQSRINVEMRHGYWTSQAARISTGRELSDRMRQSLLSLIRAASRDYRSLYADIMDQSEWAVSLADTTGEQIKTKLRSRKVNVDTLTPAQKMELAADIQNDEIKQEIKSGKLTMDSKVEQYLSSLEKKLREGEKTHEAFKKEIADDDRRITDHQIRNLLKKKDELDILNMRYEKVAQGMKSDKIARLTGKAFKTLQKYGLEVEQTRMDYNSMYKRMVDMQTSAEAIGAINAMLERRDGLFKQESINGAIRREMSAIREIRRAKTQSVKAVMRRVTFNSCDYDTGVQIMAIQKAFGPSLQKGINKWIGTEGPYLREVYTRYQTDSKYRDDLTEAIKGAKGNRNVLSLLQNKKFDEWTNTEREAALAILPKEDLYKELGIDVLEKKREEEIQLDETSEGFAEILKKALPSEVLTRVKNRPFAEWTLDEMDELGAIVDALHKKGKEVFKANYEAKRKAAESIRIEIARELMGSVNIPPERKNLPGTLEYKKQAGSFRHTIISSELAAMRMMEVAMRLDGGKRGINYDKLIFQERDCYNVYERSKDERNNFVKSEMEKIGLDVKELFEMIDFENFTQDGKTQSYSVQDLLYMYKANEDVMSREAVMYGTLTTAEEREEFGPTEKFNYDMDKWEGALTNIAEPRFAQVLAKAEELIANNSKFGQLADTIALDYAAQYDRLNEFMIREFNKPVARVEKYVPLYRSGTSGETNENRVLDDLLNTNGGRFQSGVDKGMSNKRIEINPGHQRPVELGLYSTWVKSVENTEHLIAYGSYVRELNRIYKSLDASGLREQISNAYGPSTVQYLDDQINVIANPDAGKTVTGSDKLIRSIRGSVAAAYLSWKTSGVLKQLITSPAPFFAFISPVRYAKAAMDITRNPTAMMEFINSRSEIMKKRTMDPVINMIKDMQKASINKTAAAWGEIQTIGMKGLEFADMASVAPGWLAGYRQKAAELVKANESAYQDEYARLTKKNESLPVEMLKTESEIMSASRKKVKSAEDIEIEAIKYADDITVLVQPSGRAVDLAPLFRNGKAGGGEALKLITQFQTSLNVIYNNVRYDMPTAVRNKEYGTAVRMVMSYVVAGIALGALCEGLGDGDDEEKLKKLVYYSVTQFTDSVPLVGSLVSSAAEKVITGKTTSYSGNSVFPAIEKTIQAATSLSQGDWEKAIIRAGEGFGFAVGAPVSGLKEAALTVTGNPEALIGRR
jgi:hypothetical protein